MPRPVSPGQASADRAVAVACQRVPSGVSLTSNPAAVSASLMASAAAKLPALRSVARRSRSGSTASRTPAPGAGRPARGRPPQSADEAAQQRARLLGALVLVHVGFPLPDRGLELEDHSDHGVGV